MYLGSWKIDDLLTFPANTHRFDTGAGTDADAVPDYRVYENETTTPILTGSMALLDGSNTVGFYSEQITLSAANGFEKGKSYTIYIVATVNSVTATMSHTFQIEAEVDANIVSDKTGYGLATGAITAAVIATDAIDADAIADNAIDAGAIAANAITSAKIATDAIGAAQIAADAIGASEFSQAAADKVWSTTSRTLSAFGFSVTVGTNNDKTGYSLSSAGIQAIWDALTSALTTVGSIGKLLVDNVNTTVSSRSSHSAADVWVVATRLLTAGTNIVLAKGVGVTGFNDLSAAQVNTEVDTALADYDAPTSAELVSEINSVQADIAALNNLSAAQVNAEVDTALADVNLDHLVGTATGIPAIPAGTYIDQMMDDGTAVYDRTTDSLQAIRDRGDAAWDTADVSALALQSSVDDLEGRLTATRAGYLDNLSAGAVALQASVDDLEGRLTAARAGYLDNLNVGGNVASAASIVALNNLSAAQVNAEVVDVLRTDTIPDSYSADGAQPTIAQAILAIHQFLQERSVSGTTVSVKKPDGATVVMQFTLDNGVSPTSITRTT